MWKVLGVTPLVLENTCPISLPEADNNAKPRTLRTVLTPRRRAARRRWRRRSRAGNGEGKGAVIILHARPRGRSEAPLGHLRFDGEKRGCVCSGEKGGEARGDGGGRREESQDTWSQPPSFPSLLPGSPRLHRTPRLPGPPHPCAQPLQKRPLQTLGRRG